MTVGVAEKLHRKTAGCSTLVPPHSSCNHHISLTGLHNTGSGTAMRDRTVIL